MLLFFIKYKTLIVDKQGNLYNAKPKIVNKIVNIVGKNLDVNLRAIKKRA